MSDQSVKRDQKRHYKKDLFLHQGIILALFFENNEESFDENGIFDKLSKKSKDYKQTGLTNNRLGLRYKQNTIDSIKALSKDMKLIDIKKQGKQKKIISLTTLGKEIGQLIMTIKNYDVSYSELNHAFKEKLFFLPEELHDYIDKEINSYDFSENPQMIEQIKKARINLIEKGWNWTELNFFSEIKSNLINIKNICDVNYFFMVTKRFAKIIYEYELRNQSLLIDFLGYLTKKSLVRKIDSILNDYKNEIYGFMTTKENLVQDPNETIFVSESDLVGGSYQLFKEIYSLLYKKMIAFCFETEIRNMVISYFDLAEAPLEKVDINMISQIRHLICELEEKIEVSDKVKKDLIPLTELTKSWNLSPRQRNKLSLMIKTSSLFYNVIMDYAKQKNLRIVISDLNNIP